MAQEKPVPRFSGKSIAVSLIVLLLACGCGILIGAFYAAPLVEEEPPPAMAFVELEGDAELAYLLVKLEKKCRQVIGRHNLRSQSGLPGVDLLYKRFLAKNQILPAAVSDRIFSETVPQATGGRAWVKMVVDQPRNPNNRGDTISLELVEELRRGAKAARRSTGTAEYYAEPIVATQACMHCHGTPKGAPDPFFPHYRKDGWTVGQVVGAVVARVAPEKN